ncbi:Glycosyltransferase, GT2 family [Flavobacterium sp. CF108]|uniref:glycosyltransferase family 2 protein n=1 Tax=unclassified Flavobacterium TaxID=196869 RepID=UPI0008CDE00D|nr:MULTISPECIES: glycosyltransferase [unclassified Flavobacterium]SEO77648.1 Glycosyl transferase family 2 [Flavobacterium sp. fv08]SHG78259.1 Glycosyltransferase, GT2 family [Flavobacterium sp. CF108]
MQDKSIVSIICLCYNHEKFVLQSLLSALNQDYPFIELIIVDDFSTDNSREVIKKWIVDYPEIQFIENENNLGSTKSFNKALKLAKGEYIIDLACDDILLPNCVSLQLKAFEKNRFENLGVVYGNAELINEKGDSYFYFFPVDESKKTIEKRETGDIYLSVISGGNSICSVSSMVKKSVFDDLQGYDENLAYEDLDLWIRASRKYDFDYIDEILIKKRITTTSLGTHFHIKNDSRSRKINYSTYLIIKKAIQLNRTKQEDKAILKRIHFEMFLNFKTSNYKLLSKYILLEIKQRFRIIFK